MDLLLRTKLCCSGFGAIDDVENIFLIDWISGTLSQGYYNLQSL